jgi:hypothetical protein
MLCLGTVYSWSLFARPLAAGFQWNSLRVSMVFAVGIFSLGWGAVLGGRWQDRAGPRIVSLTGVALWGLGNLLAGLGTARFGYGWLLCTYGVIGGFGNGIAYITPVATVTRWFPERRGLAGGAVSMGFGFGAVAFSGIVAHLRSFDAAARHAARYVAERDRALSLHVAFDPAPYALTARSAPPSSRSSWRPGWASSSSEGWPRSCCAIHRRRRRGGDPARRSTRAARTPRGRRCGRRSSTCSG